MSDHSCPVVKIVLEKHPNADALSIVKIGGYQCVVRTADWQAGYLATYIPPDSVCPDTPEFKFLGDHRRIKARKLRGEISFGLLIPAPYGSKIGQDMAETLGVTHYEPSIPTSTDGENVGAPPGVYPKYDVENFKSPKYRDIIEPGEEVVITEKLHGANARFVFVDGIMYAGSRANWKKYNPINLWWKALEQNPWIEEWCRYYSGLALYGEVFGQVQNLKYGSKSGEIKFRAFDVLENGKWMDFAVARDIDISEQTFPHDGWVPVLYIGPFDEKIALELAEGDSDIPGANHYREGVVICPLHERWDYKLGRVQLKIVSGRYLMKS